MITVSSLFKEASSYSHTMLSVVEVWGNGVYVGTLPLSGGKVTCDQDKKVRWNADIELAYASWDSLNLDPDQLRFKVFRGISSLGRTEMVQLGEYRMDDYNRAQRGLINISGSGLESYVADARFLQPRTPPYGASTTDTITTLVTEAVPGTFPVVNRATSDKRVTSTAPWARERIDAVNALANSIKAEAFFDGRGRLIIQDVPVLDLAVPVATFRTGPGELLISVNQKRTRDKAYNAVAVSGQSSDSSIPPVFGWAYDNNPQSSTYYYGPFGMKPRFYSSQFFTSDSQCATTAARMLYEQLAPHESFDFEVPALIWLEAGDIVQVERVDGALASYMISSLSVGLGHEDTMSCKTTGLDQFHTIVTRTE